MYRVNRLDPVSWAKNYALAALAVTLVVAVVVAIIAAMVGVVGLIAGSSEVDVGGWVALLLGGAAVLLLSLVAAAVSGFIVGLIQGIAFNWALGRTGGLEIGLALSPRMVPVMPDPARPQPPAFEPPVVPELEPGPDA
jgi:hypothetical protein